MARQLGTAPVTPAAVVARPATVYAGTVYTAGAAGHAVRPPVDVYGAAGRPVGRDGDVQ